MTITNLDRLHLLQRFLLLETRCRLTLSCSLSRRRVRPCTATLCTGGYGGHRGRTGAGNWLLGIRFDTALKQPVTNARLPKGDAADDDGVHDASAATCYTVQYTFVPTTIDALDGLL